MNLIEFAQKDIPVTAIFSLRELSWDEVGDGYRKLKQSRTGMAILEHQDAGLYDWYLVASDLNVYEVTRFGYFVRCTCPGFDFTGNCKHIALTMPTVCYKCGLKPVKHHDDICSACYYAAKARKKPAARVFQ